MIESLRSPAEGSEAETKPTVKTTSKFPRIPATWLRTMARSGTFVLQAAPQFALVVRNQLAGDDRDFNGTPATAGHQLFLRPNRFPYCIDAGAGG